FERTNEANSSPTDTNTNKTAQRTQTLYWLAYDKGRGAGNPFRTYKDRQSAAARIAGRDMCRCLCEKAGRRRGDVAGGRADARCRLGDSSDSGRASDERRADAGSAWRAGRDKAGDSFACQLQRGREGIGNGEGAVCLR